jgi:tryptophanyl-tRNA synthetase
MINKIVTGIQSTGRPHLGNILGAIMPAINLTQTMDYEQALFFIADLHTLTSNKNPQERIVNIRATAAAWLACGLDIDKCILFRQSHVPQVCELAWYLNCFTPYPMLANAHSFKDKSSKLADINAGLFTYPVLMAADILLYEATLVPVGKDQLQHLEMTRDIASAFNSEYGNVLTIPHAYINDQRAVVPGIDGQKMSKSYKNTIDIFLPEGDLLKNILSIKTDSVAINSPKNYDTCVVFNLYKLLASEEQVAEMKSKYMSSFYGYKEAKLALFELIMSKYASNRDLFNKYIHNTDAIEEVLQRGGRKASLIANTSIERIRKVMGYV